MSGQATRLRRRPALVAAAVALICVGALLGAWAWTSTSNTVAVVAVRSPVVRGAQIESGDLMVVHVSADPTLSVVPADALGEVVGRRAAVDLSQGALLTAGATTDTVVPASGRSVVGVAVPASLLPGEPLVPGDLVRVVSTPGQQGDVVDQAEPDAVAATVVGLYPGADGGLTVVAVEVPQEQAARLAAQAATGKVALVLDSRER